GRQLLAGRLSDLPPVRFRLSSEGFGHLDRAGLWASGGRLSHVLALLASQPQALKRRHFTLQRREMPPQSRLGYAEMWSRLDSCFGLLSVGGRFRCVSHGFAERPCLAR